MQLRALVIAGGFLGICATTFCLQDARSTTMYAARSGRTCDNCHVTPNRWANPKLSERKCTLSCQSCHVDPAGGGMRNASGRFYGQATVPVIATSPRPTADWDRNLPWLGRRDKATTYSHILPMGPSTFEKSVAYADSIDDRWAWGLPAGESKMALFNGRYGALNADPVFRIGYDVRLATLLGAGALFFPMQVDIPFALHPVHHATLLINTGARGRPQGYSATFDQDRSFYFREAFLLIHELPYQGYVKGGRFTPSYGLRLDDHTSRIRREFELDGSLPETRVTGIEVGVAPNYPFIQASYFRSTSQARKTPAWDIFDVDDGWGTAVNAGWRSEGWTAAMSAMTRHRPLAEGGDTDTYGVYGVLNIWHYWRHVPLTWQAEFDTGNYQTASGREADRSAFYQELDWLLYNGFNLVLAHDWSDPDRDIRDDEAHRLQLGFQFTPYPGITFDARVRSLLPTGAGGADSDLFLQLHVWN